LLLPFLFSNVHFFLTCCVAFCEQKPIGGVAVLPTGSLFGKKKDKDDKDKENKDVNAAPDQNGTDVDLNSSGEGETPGKDKKEKSKVSFVSHSVVAVISICNLSSILLCVSMVELLTT
jgi:hypothetical protein